MSCDAFAACEDALHHISSLFKQLCPLAVGNGIWKNDVSICVIACTLRLCQDSTRRVVTEQTDEPAVAYAVGCTWCIVSRGGLKI